jgi:3-deoxy-7-phosphoheptulonate synthase
LSCPVGFKNGTDGTIKIAIDAIGSASAPHHFLSVTKLGHSAIVETTGNKDCHIILRGGRSTNFDEKSVNEVTDQLDKSSLNTKVMIDFSHGNSSKKFENQMLVSTDVSQQIASGNHNIFGVMVESHLVEGRQDLVDGKTETYGQSITDACIGWSDTERLLAQLSDAVITRRTIK